MNLKDKLKELRHKLTSFSKTQDNSFQIPDSNNEEKQFLNIKISENEGVFKVEISDYITIGEYLEGIKQFDIENKLSNSVLWNSSRQCINKGKYFVFLHNGKLYNILINEELVIIEERSKKEEDVLERIIKFKTKDADYRYFSCMHDKNGSSYLTRYYSKNGTNLINLELSSEEFSDDVTAMFANLEGSKDIEDIMDIDMVRRQIFEDLNKKQIKK